MDETIEVTSVSTKSNQAVRLGAAFHRKLKIMSEEKGWGMDTIAEMLIEAEWQRTHAPGQTEAEAEERR